MLNVTGSDEGAIERRAQLAVSLALVAVAALVVSFGVFGMVWATNGSADRVDALVGLGYLGGVVVSLVAFVLAVPARRRTPLGPERRVWSPLWLPLGVFPTLLAVWVLALVQHVV